MGRRHRYGGLAAAAAFVWLAGAGLAAAEPAGADTEVSAPQAAAAADQAYGERKALFEETSTITGIRWFDLAAADQYERTMNFVKKRTPGDGLVAVFFSPEDWAGLANPDRTDTSPLGIAAFGGKGLDGNGDGRADRNSDLDRLAAFARHITKFGTDEENFRIGLWEYYQNNRAVERILQFSKIYAAYGTLDLFTHAFPLPLGADYSYRDTWGASRGWGGDRIHEGTDLFAHHGVPVRSTCYGIIEVMGWNPFGGWRVGIRDLNNVYHYYAHLSGFSKEVKTGDVVKPAQVIGWVGSSGYGKPGTSGKFPPHLHFGLYRDNGLAEWSFDPYSHLKKWEREERAAGRKKK
jgi:peptidoglycan LD-endopeptidase LytH